MIYWHNNLELIWNVPNHEKQFMYAPNAADWRKRRKKILHLKWDFPSLASEAKIATISHWSQSLHEASHIWITTFSSRHFKRWLNLREFFTLAQISLGDCYHFTLESKSPWSNPHLNYYTSSSRHFYRWLNLRKVFTLAQISLEGCQVTILNIFSLSAWILFRKVIWHIILETWVISKKNLRLSHL